MPSSEGAFDPASDDSYEELDAIIPTFPEQISPPNSVDKYYSGCTGFVEAQMRTLQQGDANMYFDSAFYSYTRLPTQQGMREGTLARVQFVTDDLDTIQGSSKATHLV